MSGQTPLVTFEQDALDSSSGVEIGIDNENLDIVDPLAEFIKDHGYKLVRNHEGELVTVVEAIENCPPFKRLVLAMGEGALALMATQKPEEENEEAEELVAEKEKEEKEETIGEQTQGTAEQETVTAEVEISVTQPQDETEAASLETAVTDGAQSAVNNTETISEAIYQEGSGYGEFPVNDVVSVETSKPEKFVDEPSKNKTQSSPPKPAETSDQSISATVSPVPRVRPVRSVPLPTTSRLPNSTEIISGSRPLNIASLEKDYAAADNEPAPKLATKVETPIEENPVVLEPIGQTPETQAFEDMEINDILESPEASMDIIQNENHSVPTPEIAIQLPETVNLKTFAYENKSIDDPNGNDELLHGFASTTEWANDEEINILAVNPDLARVPASEALPLEFEAELPRAEITGELPAPVELIEQTILELSEKIEQLKPQEKLSAHEILDAIVLEVESIHNQPEKPMGDDASESLLTEPDAQEDLKELFIRLFDELEIDYTPELIESFTKLALKGDISKFVSSIEGSPDASIDKGMHEAISKLLAAVASMKKATLQAYQIGKSTLRLYTQQFAPA